jgi:very-short-patch-repair endonuclease
MSSSGVIRLQRLSDGKLRQARALRANMTEAETILWERLRRKGILNVKFRRQQVIEGFIVDFYCEAVKLVIEVDGSVHDTENQKAVDEHRRKVFQERGLKELRFSNQTIVTDIETVMQMIRMSIEEKDKFN